MSGKSGGLSVLLERPRPSTLQQFIKEPCIFLAKKLYKWRWIIGFDPIKPIAIVCISDTHNSQPSDIPPGEVLIHAGDITQTGTLKEIQTSLDWINSLPHPHKVLIAGNHDILLDHTDPRADPVANASINWGNITYLDSESTTISCTNGRELKIYGSPLTPRHGNWAFQYPRNQNVWHHKIPAGTDILITHGPPKGHLDAGYFGCKHLLDEVWRAKPRLHVFGHVHDGHGMEWIQFDGLQRAYENIVIAGGGLWNLSRVVFEFLRAHSTPIKESRVLFVNPAIAGGLRDEQRRPPITVHV
ncbi:Metallo-dependent phosphatase [Cucurbitaria berberidis CBS 394.84]|uniref:Metallo-dependent phosphatase n=1 Tax=Cucurbitaria berberidis CBS 394.84 TaxID=1168544 RepID=A0A9P4L9S0_9PLEO|nr:Metallo-dependent phosphatase [Cucurbitaria berberidis CBS 394.84]KAF1846499.1 Metallo-dependent phosphatase [Cucurbitaria berberidis CBS 394.84]